MKPIKPSGRSYGPNKAKAKFPKDKGKRRGKKTTMKEIKSNPDSYYDWEEENFEKFRR